VRIVCRRPSDRVTVSCHVGRRTLPGPPPRSAATDRSDSNRSAAASACGVRRPSADRPHPPFLGTTMTRGPTL